MSKYEDEVDYVKFVKSYKITLKHKPIEVEVDFH